MSSGSDKRSQAIGVKLRMHARCNRDLYAQVPAPDTGEWLARDHFDVAGDVATLQSLGVVRCIGKRRRNRVSGEREHVRVWTTVAHVYNALDERGLLDPDRPPIYGGEGIGCPSCGRTSLRNLNGEDIECKQCGTVAHKSRWRGGDD